MFFFSKTQIIISEIIQNLFCIRFDSCRIQAWHLDHSIAVRDCQAWPPITSQENFALEGQGRNVPVQCMLWLGECAKLDILVTGGLNGKIKLWDMVRRERVEEKK